jgi:hypothetical protein
VEVVADRDELEARLLGGDRRIQELAGLELFA